MEYTDNLMYTNTEISIVTLTYPIIFLTQCLCNVLVIGFFVFTSIALFFFKICCSFFCHVLVHVFE